MATIVTCYFQLNKSKASHSHYVDWMTNMLANQNPMVIFCDLPSSEIIRSLRPSEHNTHIIITSFMEFHCYQYIEAFINHFRLDHENKIHSIPLYMIWNEKSHFLKTAIELNPFSTDYFLWVDIGCFRKPNTDYLQWPNAAKIATLPKNKVLLLSVVPFTSTELETTTLDQMPSFQTVNRIGAPIFGGEAAVLLEWHDLYYSMLEYFIRIHRFIGKDQSIMNSVYLLNREKCDLVSWIPSKHDPWFYLQEYLR